MQYHKSPEARVVSGEIHQELHLFLSTRNICVA
jgi:hypothetical protein